MSTAISSRSALTITAVTVVGGLIAYAAYFDYKRRNDPSFRKKLRKEKKRVERTQPSVAIPGQSRSIDEIKAALHSLRDEQLPETAEEKEQYFMDNVQAGEQLCTQGPLFEVPAALAFYRALRVYPSPVELIMIYQKTVPEPIFKMVMEMTTLDVSATPAAPSVPVVEVESPKEPALSLEKAVESGEEGETTKVESGPPSETESQEWDTLTDPGSATSASQTSPFGPTPP